MYHIFYFATYLYPLNIAGEVNRTIQDLVLFWHHSTNCKRIE